MSGDEVGRGFQVGHELKPDTLLAASPASAMQDY